LDLRADKPGNTKRLPLFELEMRTPMKRLLYALVLAALAMATAVAGNITFVTWDDTNVNTPFNWTGSSYTATIPVEVTLQASGVTNSSIISSIYNIPVGTSFVANMTYNWTPTGILTGAVGDQTETYSGSVEIVDNDRAGASGQLILDAVFGDSSLTDVDTTGNTGLNWKATVPGGMSFYSNIMTFTGLTGGTMSGQSSDFQTTSAECSSIGSPAWCVAGQLNATPGGALALFSGTASGSFSANPIAQAEAPEPGTFAMLGSALVVAGLFGRRRFMSRTTQVVR
jgi:hypothetical protein